MHITSLPSKYGIGTLGKEAFSFVDFLKKSGQHYWQILPVGPTSYGDSPYQSFSSFAGNPLLIDLDLLIKDRLLTKAECGACDFGDGKRVDYEKQFNNKFALLKTASERFFKKDKTEDFEEFCKREALWLDDYALFMALKYANGQKPWYEWDKPLAARDKFALEQAFAELSEEVLYWKFVQYVFDWQYKRLFDYCHENGIEIIGDMPIYAAHDSADVWANPEVFMLDEDKNPIDVAGCPPDYFSEDGQLWGNPIYNWQYLRDSGYKWWWQRIKKQYERFDVLRIDHFRAFDTYYAIPFGSENAKNGEWRKGPGREFFDTVRFACGDIRVIAEDLGELFDSVRELLEWSGYPGLNVLQFGFTAGCEGDYLPHKHKKNSVVYTGTHDNDTTRGWLENCSKADFKFARDYMRLSESEGLAWGVIRTAYSSTADLAVIPMQDFLELGSEARMNTPSTPAGNWQWRAEKKQLSDALAKKIKALAKLYFR